MTKIAIQQPYFFPYVGYFELIKEVDCFIFLTNAQFVRRSWMTRNFIRSEQKERQYINIPCYKSPQVTKINEIKLLNHNEFQYQFLNKLLRVYGKKILNNDLFRSLGSIYYSGYSYTYLSDYLIFTTYCVCKFLNIETEFCLDNSFVDLRGVKRLKALCEHWEADTYFNLPSGKSLYKQEDFGDICLKIMEMTKSKNKLSILDLIFGDNVTCI